MWVARFFVVDVTDRSLTRYQEVRFIARELERILKYCTVVCVPVHQIRQIGLSQKKAHLVKMQINGGLAAAEVNRSTFWGKTATFAR